MGYLVPGNNIPCLGVEFPDGSLSMNPLSQALRVLSEISLELDLGDPRSAQISVLFSELQLESSRIPMLQFERYEQADEKRKAKLIALKVCKRVSILLYIWHEEVFDGTIGPFKKPTLP